MNRKNSNYSGRQKGRLSKIGIWSKCTSQRSFQAVFHLKSVKYSDQETRSTDERKENRSHRISSRQNNLLTHLLRSGNIKINLRFDQCKRINSNLSQLRSTNFYRFIHWNTLYQQTFVVEINGIQRILFSEKDYPVKINEFAKNKQNL